MGAGQSNPQSTTRIQKQLSNRRRNLTPHQKLTELSPREIEALGENSIIVQTALLNLFFYQLLSPDTRAAAIKAGEYAYTFCNELKSLSDYGISTKDNIEAIAMVKKHMHCLSMVFQKLHTLKMLNTNNRVAAVKAAQEGKLPLEIVQEIQNNTAIQGIQNLSGTFYLSKPILDIVASFFKTLTSASQSSEQISPTETEFNKFSFK